MEDALLWHRLQFAFTAVFHYIFPQLTMGLALIIVLFKSLHYFGRGEVYGDAARFWTRLFGLNFAVGVVTGLPLEFQFGTNWGRFSDKVGGVVGQTLAMEGMFAFFLESTFLGLLVFGERKLSKRAHYGAAIALWVGSWLSGFFVIVANAFMQHPVGFSRDDGGTFALADFSAFVFNPWALWQYAHTMSASCVTAAFVVCAVAAFWLLQKTHLTVANASLTMGSAVGLVATLLVAFPTGDGQAKMVAMHQPVTLAAMEGRFESGGMAELTVLGQPNVAARRLDNPINLPGVLSFVAYGFFDADVRGLNEFSERDWPTNIELLYYCFHIMVGLGTLMIAMMAFTVLQSLRRKIHTSRALLWALMLAFPFPYIANTAGWLTTELGRQPWLVYGLMRTVDGSSPTVHSGTALFTLIGFCGLYFVVGVTFLFLAAREIMHGPEHADASGSTAAIGGY